MRLSKSRIKGGDSVTASIDVKNIGDRAGDEIVQLYIRDEYSRVTRPVKELKGFKRVSLKSGETRKVKFEITPDMLAYYDLELQWRVEPGDFKIMLGSSSRDRHLNTVKLNVAD